MVQDGAALGSCKGMVEGDLDTDAGCSMHEAAKLAESMIGARTPCAWCIGCMPVVHTPRSHTRSHAVAADDEHGFFTCVTRSHTRSHPTFTPRVHTRVCTQPQLKPGKVHRRRRSARCCRWRSVNTTRSWWRRRKRMHSRSCGRGPSRFRPSGKGWSAGGGSARVARSCTKNRRSSSCGAGFVVRTGSGVMWIWRRRPPLVSPAARKA